MPRSIADIRKANGGLGNLTDEDILQSSFQNYKSYYPSLDAYAAEIGYEGAGRGLTGSRVSAGIDQYQAGLLGVGGAVSRSLGANNVAGAFDRRRVANESAADYAQQQAANLGGISDFRDVTGVSSALNYAGGLAAQSLPYLGEAVVGAATGGLALGGTAARMGLTRAAARQAGAVAAGYPSGVGDILSAQRDSGGENLGSALIGGVPYAALNAVGIEGQLARGLRPLVSVDGSLTRRVAAGVGTGALGESASETGQELINQVAGRMAVDPNETLFNEAANRRYVDSAVGGATLGGLFGGAGGIRRPQRPDEESDLTKPLNTTTRPDPSQFVTQDQTVGLQKFIDVNTGVERPSRKGYAKQFEAAFNEPSGQFVADAATGVERELTTGEVIQRGDTAMDLTGATPANTAAASTAAASVANSRDPRDIFLRDELKVVPNNNSRQLFTLMEEQGVDPKSEAMVSVWNYASEKYMSPKRLIKATELMDAAIIESRKEAANGTPISANQQPTGSLGDGGAVVPRGLGIAGRAAPVPAPQGAVAAASGTPVRETSLLPSAIGESTPPVNTGILNAPQAQQTKTQGQTTTREGAGTTSLVDTSDDALEIARATGNAAEIEAMREDEAGLRTEVTSLSEDDAARVIAARFAKSKNAKRDTTILNAYLTALRTDSGTDKTAIQNAIGDKYGITAVTVRKIGNPSMLVAAGADLGFSPEQVLDLFNVDDNTKAQFTEIGKLETEISNLRKAYSKAADADKRSEVADRMTALSERITKINDKADRAKSAAFSAGLQEAGVVSVEGESAGFGLDTEREWTRVEGESKIASTILELSNQIESLQEAVAQLDAQGQTAAADAARDAIATRQAKIDAVLATVQAETKPVASKAAPDVAEARKRWNDAGRDLTKLSVEDLQVLKGYTASINNKALSDKITAEISSRGAPQETSRAVQVESAASVPVQTKGDSGKKDGGQVRRAKKPAAESKAQVPAVIRTEAEQAAQAWDVVAADFPEAPKFADLTKTQQQDFIDFGPDNWDRGDVETELTKLASAEKKAAPTATNTPEQIAQAKRHAAAYGGTVVWQKGDVALVRGYSMLSGKPVYMPTKGDLLWGKDIESISNPQLTDIKGTLVTAKNELEAADAAKHESTPFITFDKGGLAVSSNVDARLSGVIAGWKNLLNLKANIYVTTIDDARADKDKFTGPHRVVGSAGLAANEAGSMRKMDGGYYIAFTKGTSYTKMLETIAHELGHVHEREAFENAPAELKNAIRAEHNKFLKSQTGVSGKQFVEALRARSMGRSTTGLDNIKADQLTSYWKSFSEWYADQVSKWATTSEKPVGVVEQFFAKLGAALKKFYYSLKGAKYLPSETMKKFLDDVANRTIVIDPTTVSDDRGSQPILDGVRSNNNGYAAKTAPTQGLIDRNIAKLPKMSQQSVKRLTETLSDLGGAGLDYVVFTSGLIKRAVAAGLPAAQTFSDRLAARSSRVSQEERKIEKIADRYASIEDANKGSGPGSANEFLLESTRTGKWGYDTPKVKADPAMKLAFDKLGPKAQQFVKDVFAHGDSTLSNKKTVVLNATNSEYDAMIKAAQDAGDTKTEATLKTEKAATLKRFQTLFRIREGIPYAPIKRTGSYVVIGKSAKYLKAEANSDSAAMKKMESDPDEYHVSFTDTKWQARSLRDKLAEQGVFTDPQVVSRSESFDQAFSGEALLPALTKMRAAVDRRAQDVNGKKDPTAGKLLNIVNQLYLEALAEGSARKSEMRRRGVAGEVDMLQSFTQQGRSDANFLASVEYEPKIQEALQQMRNQSRTGDRERKSEIFDELTKRYAGTLDPQPSPFINGLTNMASKFFLASSPGYYLQNLTQPFMMSLPAMAGRHNYTKAAAELAKAYGELGPVFKNVKLFDEQFDFSKVPADVRKAINELVNQGKIDIGLATEINEYKVEADSKLSQFAQRLNRGMRLAVQKVEATNRLSTAIAAYRLEFARTKDADKATQYAADILTDTHGDYTAFNAPRAFNTQWGKVALQFRKFQLIQIAFYAKLIRDAFTKPDERAAAMKTLAFSLSHTAVFAGMMGMPGYAAISFMLGLFGDDDEPYDLTADMRKALGPEWANMIMRGAPTVAGMDLSGKIGAGNMLSVMPFSNADLSTNAGRAEALGTLMGGAAFGMTSRIIDGLGLIVSGDYYKGVERTMPKGVSDALKAGRQGAEGLTRRNGDVILPASEVSALDTVFTALGMPAVKQAVTYERQNRMRDVTENFTERTTRIKNDYAKAVREKDTAAMAEARTAWTKLQQTRQSNGLAPQPVSNLLKAPQEQKAREQRTINGVSYRQGQQKLAESIAEN